MLLNGSPNKEEYELDGVIKNGVGLSILGEGTRENGCNKCYLQSSSNK